LKNNLALLRAGCRIRRRMPPGFSQELHMIPRRVCWCFPISVYCLSVVEVATCHIRRPLKMWEVPADSRQIYTPLFTHS